MLISKVTLTLTLDINTSDILKYNLKTYVSFTSLNLKKNIKTASVSVSGPNVNLTLAGLNVVLANVTFDWKQKPTD